MADKNRIDHDPENLENLSPEELQKRIEEDKKNAKRSLRFAFTALIAIIAVCIAWFVSNNQVTMTGTQIESKNNLAFELASVGDRQNAEKDKLKNDNKNILSEGKKETFSKYNYKASTDRDSSTWSVKNNSQIYYTGSSQLAWHLPEQENFYPGASGKLEFYLIPRQENLTRATITLELGGYTDGNNQEAVKSDDIRLQELISGHILLFQNLDDEKGYSGWLGNWVENTNTITNTFTVTADKFEKDVPYKITLRWVWPQYFRNYIYTLRDREGDLFTNKADLDSNTGDYKKINAFVNGQKTFKNSRIFYKATNQADEKITGTDNIVIDSSTISDKLLDECSKYYNQADEYIEIEHLKKAFVIYVEAIQKLDEVVD